MNIVLIGYRGTGKTVVGELLAERLGMTYMEMDAQIVKKAGMPIPERDPRAQEKADARTQLVEVMEQAVQYHRLQLQTAAAAEALERRRTPCL